MFPFWIVVSLNKPKNLLFGMIDRFKRQAIDMLNFKRVKKALTHGIIITIAFAAHAANQAVRLDQPLIRPRTILAASIGMHHNAFGISPFSERHLERITHQLCIDSL